MSANRTLEQAGIKNLTVSERLELIGLIWDTITDEETASSVPDWHRQELERRRAAAEANPEAGIPWEMVKSRLRQPR